MAARTGDNFFLENYQKYVHNTASENKFQQKTFPAGYFLATKTQRHKVSRRVLISNFFSDFMMILSLPQNENDLDRLISLSDFLMDQIQGNEKHPLTGLLEIVGTLISDYEKHNIPEPAGTPAGCLRHLMEEHGLNPADLPEIGSPDTVSEILSGKYDPDKNQIMALSRRFGCSPAVFL